MPKKMKRSATSCYPVLALLSVIYVALTLLAPVKSNNFDLTDMQVRLLQLTFVVPILVIWFLIVFGGVRFKNYALLIKGSDEAKGTSLVANSLLLIGFGGIVVSIFNLGRNFVGSQFTEEFVITHNLFNVIVQLGSYGLLYVGSTHLLKSIGVKGADARKAIYPQLAMSVAIAAYGALMFLNPYRNSTPDPTKYSSFYLPDGLLLVLVVIPYVLSWSLAVGALVNLRTFAAEVRGIIYREAIHRLVMGMTIVVSFAIALAMLSTLSGLFADSSLKFVLGFIYVILILYAAGFLVIASGARKLARIEEV